MMPLRQTSVNRISVSDGRGQSIGRIVRLRWGGEIESLGYGVLHVGFGGVAVVSQMLFDLEGSDGVNSYGVLV